MRGLLFWRCRGVPLGLRLWGWGWVRCEEEERRACERNMSRRCLEDDCNAAARPPAPLSLTAFLSRRCHDSGTRCWSGDRSRTAATEAIKTQCRLGCGGLRPEISEEPSIEPPRTQASQGLRVKEAIESSVHARCQDPVEGDQVASVWIRCSS